jgi:uracil-DNA glycosylase
MIGVFPFGQPVCEVIQTDRSSKKAFILGVYASAVHARWVGTNDKTIVAALAVASEPYIFWRGENAENIINNIDIPKEVGSLLPASTQFNGPSGRALDELILRPMKLSRGDVWLCDLVPHSCANPAQNKAIQRTYAHIYEKYGLPNPTVPPVPTVLTNEKRREEIWAEIQESSAETLLLLGDKPIQWFLAYFIPRWRRLDDFLNEGQAYGKPFTTHINDKHIRILPLAHPRQIARLGRSSPKWYQLHQKWIREDAAQIFVL